MIIKRKQLNTYSHTLNALEHVIMCDNAKEQNQDITAYCFDSINYSILEILEKLEFSVTENLIKFPVPGSEKAKMIDSLFFLIEQSYDHLIIDKFTSDLIWTYLLKLRSDGDIDYSGSYPEYLWTLIKSYCANINLK